MNHLAPLILPVLDEPADLSESTFAALYFKTDGKLYKRNSEGLTTQVSKITHTGSLTMALTNQEAQSMEYGHLVVLDTANPLSVKFSSTYFGNGLIGVVAQGAAAGQSVLVQFAGVIDVQMDSYSVDIGDYIIGSSQQGKATSYFSEYIGVIGRALTAKGSGDGTVKVLLAGGLPEIF